MKRTRRSKFHDLCTTIEDAPCMVSGSSARNLLLRNAHPWFTIGKWEAIRTIGTNHCGKGYTVKTVPTEIQSQKSAEIQSVYVAFHVHAQLQRPVPTETYSPVTPQRLRIRPMALVFYQTHTITNMLGN